MTDPAQPQPRQSSERGCLTVAFIGAGVMFVLLLLAGIAIWRFTRTEKGKQMVGAMTDAFKMATDGMKAPGTEELRKAGCKQAMVLDMQRAMNVGRAFAPAGPNGPATPPVNSMVTCMMGFFDTPMECDPVAKIYAQALGGSAAEPFFAMVQKQGSREYHCMGLYSKEGTLLKRAPPAGQKAEPEPDAEPALEATPDAPAEPPATP